MSSILLKLSLLLLSLTINSWVQGFEIVFEAKESHTEHL